MHACIFRKRSSHNWFSSNRFNASRPCFTLSHLACLLVFALAALASAQTTIHVPADQLTIQAGINAANNGDTVLVAPGTYFENIDFKGKAITVISAAGSTQTIIDGSKGNTQTVSFISKEPRTAILSGFTIQGGGAEPYIGNNDGGIVILNNSQPSLVNNIITHNHCDSIYVDNSSPLIQNNNINNTLDNKGDCSFGGGAAIYLAGSAEDSSGNQIPIIISGNTIEDNTQSGLEDAGGNGGAGIAIWGGNPIIENNIIRNNLTGGAGGAINFASYDPVNNKILIVQNLIYGNQAAGGGGAIGLNAFSYLVNIYIANNTIVDNTPYSQDGGGGSAQIYAAASGQDGPNVAFVNNIIAGNTTQPSIQCDWQTNPPIVPDESIQPIFDHNLFLNRGGAVLDSSCVDVTAKYGNIVADPMFVNWTGMDYHLQTGSPAIDAGNTSVLQSLADNALNLTTDYDGNPRVADTTAVGYPIIDMGAYEFAGAQDAQPTTIVLTPSEFVVQGETNFTLTAQVVSAAGTPTGSVAFLEDGTQIGTAPIDSSGQAVFPSPPLVTGTHNFIAIYPAPGVTNSTLPPARSVVAIVVAQADSSVLTLSSTPNPSQAAANVTFTLNLSAPNGLPSGQITLADQLTNTTLATLTPDAKGNASFATAALAAGIHNITASYPGDSTHTSASASVEQQVGNGIATTISLTSLLNPSNVGQTVTINAIVSSSNGTPTGSLQFLDGSTNVGIITLIDASASLVTSILTPGKHNISAIFTPSGNYLASSASITQIVNGLTTATALTASPNPAYALQTVTLAAKITTTANGTPTGTVTFNDGAILLGTANLAANGTAMLPATFPAVSATPHQLTATYSGDSTFSSGTSAPYPETIQFNPTTTLITTMLPNPVSAYSTVTLSATVSSSTSTGNFPTGSVTFTTAGMTLGTGVLVNGSVSIPVIAPAVPGGYRIVANYSGDTAFFPSASPSQVLQVIRSTASVTITSSENPSVFGDSVTFAGVVSSANPAPISGHLQFFDGTKAIGPNFTLDETGTAAFSISTLAVGRHSITAVYSGNPYILNTTSSVLSQVVTPYLGDFTLNITPDNGIVYTGGAAHFTLVATPVNGFDLALLLTCSGLPANSRCGASPARILANPEPGTEFFVPYTSLMTIQTSSPRPESAAHLKQASWTGGAAALACLCGILIIPRRIRRALSIRSLLIGAILVGTFAAISGCGNHGSLTGATPIGTYEVTITAKTPSGGPQVSHSIQFKLVVKSLF
ncbi:Ig-like domain-containing protein [Terracidiphilus gabretensis]|uniref:Ig-like domain-containing protein n=1 Tax=Terracidiphilus gabretensis TaxID=1577687 RepID=UPI00071B0E3A|nr:Ig-like domain-containing protein [Terracidiphilus gabretensis]